MEMNISWLKNETEEENVLYPAGLVVPITVVYGLIFVTGLLGNVSTCIVIANNKSMHTATNYYLFSLAVSDLLLLVSGLPPEMYRIWSPETYVFGDAICVLQGYAAETSANATVLTITAFTVERYLAICHPFLSHTMSKLSRVVKYVIVIWIAALCLAAPQALQFGVQYDVDVDIDDGNATQRSRCTVVSNYFQHAFEISTFLFFVGPMTLITVLYVLIAVKLHKSRLLAQKRTSHFHHASNGEGTLKKAPRTAAAQKRVIKMLVAVVVAFFLCWAPFHAQRLLAVYLSTASKEAQNTLINLYIALMYTSGVLYFVSTTINPVLYHIMSKKFREAFQATFMQVRRGRSVGEYDRRMYSSLLRNARSFKGFPKLTGNGIKPSSSCDVSSSKDAVSGEQQADVRLLEQLDKDKLDDERRVSALDATTCQTSQMTGEAAAAQRLTTITTTTTSSLPKKPIILVMPTNKTIGSNGILGGYNMFRLFGNKRDTFMRQGSVESAQSTNTISNSSLQDMDESEFNTSELAQYMEEVNHGIV